MQHIVVGSRAGKRAQVFNADPEWYLKRLKAAGNNVEEIGA